ncbi:PEX16 [Bugula neritina]|uniref:Peroxisomal membrane protein PEX16 n=1 Tax=Bugula neritina TaxID=10212 RepID=A0A7J7KLP0_BUGNE|nr:PEX16 [Bugula neritina]
MLQVESWMKTLSYCNIVIAELMYSSSSLFTLFNDYMLRKRHGLHTLQGAGARRLKIALSCLEAVEVFIEIAARRYADPNIKWILIFCVELLKTIGRFVLQLKYKSGLRYFPLINRLNRKAIHMDGVEERTDDSQSSNNQSYYTLPHSGRQIKSVNTGSWQGVASAPVSVGKTVLDKGQMVGEALHNLQPLIHLGTEACFGAESWKPWIASIITDLASLGILKTVTLQI